MADDRIFKVKIITPDRIFYEGNVTMVEFRTSEGEIGIYKNHIPLTTILVPGIARLTAPDGIKLAAFYTGFAEILKDRVTILAEAAEWPDEIDINRANEARIRAERRLKGEDGNVDVMRAQMALNRALVRIELHNK